MDNLKLKKYELSIWQDEVETTDFGSSDSYLFVNSGIRTGINEKKLCIIGSHTMTSNGRARNVNLVRNVNGSNTITFSVLLRYPSYNEFHPDALDKITHITKGEFVRNPIVDLLQAETKLKMWVPENKQNGEDEWLEFLIKKVEEDSTTGEIRYTATDLFINELARTGYQFAFSTEAGNNMGTAQELAKKVLENSDWVLDENNSDMIVNTDLVYSNKFTLSLNQKKLYLLPYNYEELLNKYQTTFAVQVTDSYDINYGTSWYGDESHKGVQQYILDQNIKLLELNPTLIYITSIPQDKYDAQCQIRAFNFSPKMGYDKEKNGYYEYYANKTPYSQKSKPSEVKKCKRYSYIRIFSPHFAQSIIEGNIPTIKDTTIATVDLNSLRDSIDKLSRDYFLISYPVEQVQQIEQGTNWKIINNNDNNNIEIPIEIVKSSQSVWEDSNFGLKKVKYALGKLSSAGIDALKTAWNKGIDNFTMEFNVGKNSIPSDLQIQLISSYIKQTKNVYKENLITSNFPQTEEVITPIYKETVIPQYDYYDEEENFLFSTFSETNSTYPYPLIDINNQKITQIEESDSNRFNLLQTICENFKCWMKINVRHKKNGKLETQNWYFDKKSINSKMSLNDAYFDFTEDRTAYKIIKGLKTIGGILASTPDAAAAILGIDKTEVGTFSAPIKTIQIIETPNPTETQVTFDYGKNLNSIKRTVNSEQISTYIIVENNEIQAAKKGLCSIRDASSNPSRENAIINFDYYIERGLLNRNEVNKDLYGNPHYDKNNLCYFWFMKQLNNEIDTLLSEYNKVANELIGLQATAKIDTNAQAGSYDKLVKESNKLSNATSGKIELNINNIITALQSGTISVEQIYNDIWTNNNSYISFNEIGDKISNLFSSDNVQNILRKDTRKNLQDYYSSYHQGNNYISLYAEKKARVEQLDSFLQTLYDEKKLHYNKFYQKYQAYIQEGVWSETIYIDPNQYYSKALDVAATSSKPQITYDIQVTDLSPLDSYEIGDNKNYNFELGQKTYVIDPYFFGEEQKEEVIITEIAYNFDNPEQTKITVQNYRTRFEDLFQRISASVQSLQYADYAYNKINNIVADDGTLILDNLQQAINRNGITLKNVSGQEIVQDETGITVTSKYEPQKMLRIIADGIYVSRDSGNTFINALSIDGVSADIITSGILNTQQIIISNGDKATFRWDSDGISAYKWSKDNSDNIDVDLSQFVRYDQYGLYGINHNTYGWKANSIKDIEDNATFGATWNGFFVNGQNGDYRTRIDGYGFKLEKISDTSPKIYLGYWTETINGQKTNIYGIKFYGNDNNPVLYYDATNGTLDLTLKSLNIAFSNIKDGNTTIKGYIDKEIVGSDVFSSLDKEIKEQKGTVSQVVTQINGVSANVDTANANATAAVNLANQTYETATTFQGNQNYLMMRMKAVQTKNQSLQSYTLSGENWQAYIPQNDNEKAYINSNLPSKKASKMITNDKDYGINFPLLTTRDKTAEFSNKYIYYCFSYYTNTPDKIKGYYTYKEDESQGNGYVDKTNNETYNEVEVYSNTPKWYRVSWKVRTHNYGMNYGLNCNLNATVSSIQIEEISEGNYNDSDFWGTNWIESPWDAKEARLGLIRYGDHIELQGAADKIKFTATQTFDVNAQKVNINGLGTVNLSGNDINLIANNKIQLSTGNKGSIIINSPKIQWADSEFGFEINTLSSEDSVMKIGGWKFTQNGLEWDMRNIEEKTEKVSYRFVKDDSDIARIMGSTIQDDIYIRDNNNKLIYMENDWYVQINTTNNIIKAGYPDLSYNQLVFNKTYNPQEKDYSDLDQFDNLLCYINIYTSEYGSSYSMRTMNLLNKQFIINQLNEHIQYSRRIILIPLKEIILPNNTKLTELQQIVINSTYLSYAQILNRATSQNQRIINISRWKNGDDLYYITADGNQAYMTGIDFDKSIQVTHNWSGVIIDGVHSINARGGLIISANDGNSSLRLKGKQLILWTDRLQLNDMQRTQGGNYNKKWGILFRNTDGYVKVASASDIKEWLNKN